MRAADDSYSHGVNLLKRVESRLLPIYILDLVDNESIKKELGVNRGLILLLGFYFDSVF